MGGCCSGKAALSSKPAPPVASLRERRPLLFHNEESDVEVDFTFITMFPMYLIPVPTMLTLEWLDPHQVLKGKGFLQEWDEKHHLGRVIFVSHEWLGFSHADPKGEQLSALQRLLEQLIHGSIDVESHDQQKGSGFKHNQSVAGARWAAALPYMYIWFDFISIPQVEGCDSSTDEGNFKGELKCAVDSIPAYIQRCVLVVVLVPLCQHFDKGSACSYATWRSRGWCRLEFQIASLADSDIKVMICQGSAGRPYFVKLSDTWKLLAADGNFTCCQRGHIINGSQITCDKKSVSNIVSHFLHHQSQKLSTLDRHQRARIRHMICLSQWLTLGIQGMEAQEIFQKDEWKSNGSRLEPLAEDDKQSASAILKERLCWEPEEDSTAEQQGGRTLLYYAALSNDAFALGDLIGTDMVTLIDNRLSSVEKQWGERPLTPLMAAMIFGTFRTVHKLLDARADPDIEIPGGNAFMLACAHGRASNIEAWLARFPDCNLEWTTTFGKRTYGNTVLMSTVLNAPEPGASSVVDVLLSARANVNAGNAVGNNVLESACSNDNAMIDVIHRLLKAQADVNHIPGGSVELVVSEILTRVSSSSLVAHSTSSPRVRRSMSRMSRSSTSMWNPDDEPEDAFDTALMLALRRSKVDEVHALINARADISIQNANGENIFEIGELLYGSFVPKTFESALRLLSPQWYSSSSIFHSQRLRWRVMEEELCVGERSSCTTLDDGSCDDTEDDPDLFMV